MAKASNLQTEELPVGFSFSFLREGHIISVFNKNANFSPGVTFLHADLFLQLNFPIRRPSPLF